MVLVDSDVWSLAFRRSVAVESPSVSRLRQLVITEEAKIIGLIRQEVLSGIRHQEQFETVRLRMRAFPDEPVTGDIHELAAHFYNICRSHGIQGSHTDFLVCACAVSWDMKILTLDRDFARYQAWLPIELEAV